MFLKHILLNKRILNRQLFQIVQRNIKMPEYLSDELKQEKDYTLIFVRRKNPNGDENDDQVLLGMKKRGFGVGKINGYGGKVEGKETNDQACIRELNEESTLIANSIKRLGYLVFDMEEARKILKVHVYETWDYTGEAIETDEMKPYWYNVSDIPYDKMWPDDIHWLPMALQGKSFMGRFEYEDDETIIDYSIREQ